MESPILITKSVSAQRKLLCAHPIKIKWSREARRGAHCNHRKKGQLQTQQKMPPQERIKCRLQQGGCTLLSYKKLDHPCNSAKEKPPSP